MWLHELALLSILKFAVLAPSFFLTLCLTIECISSFPSLIPRVSSMLCIIYISLKHKSCWWGICFDRVEQSLLSSGPCISFVAWWFFSLANILNLDPCLSHYGQVVIISIILVLFSLHCWKVLLWKWDNYMLKLMVNW